jgi:iron complex transport system substrate-binding protein
MDENMNSDDREDLNSCRGSDNPRRFRRGHRKENPDTSCSERFFRSLTGHILKSSFLAAFPLLLFAVCSLVHGAEPPKRIISLAPGMTELLFALGLEDRLVGVTNFCDYPEAAKNKPKIGGMSNPSLESVLALKPDIVVMTVDGNPKEFEERLRGLKIKTYVFRARRLPEFSQGVREMGAALGVREKAELLAGEIDMTLKKFSVTGRSAMRKKVLFIIWPEPLIVAGRGSITDDAFTLLGEKNIANDSRTSYPKYSIEEIIRRAPDVIFIGRGTGMEKVSEGLLRRLKTVPAVKNGRVFYVSDYLYRLTPRTVRGVEELAGYLEQQK